MSSVIGRGRYARATYPVSSGAGSVGPLDQDAWFIDGQNVSGKASNTNDGKTRDTPLLDHTVFRQRIDFGPLHLPTTVTLMSDLRSGDVMFTDYNSDNTNLFEFDVTYEADLTTVRATDTILAYTNRDPSTNTPNLLTSTAAINWNDFVGGGFIVRFTSGAASGFAAYVAKDLTGNQCRLSTVFKARTSQEVQPSPGDTFIIQKMVQVPVVIFGGSNAAFEYNNIYFRGSSFAGFVPLGQSLEIFTTYNECAFPRLQCIEAPGASVINCQMNRPPAVQLCPMFIPAGIILDATQEGTLFNASCNAFLSRGLLLQGSFIDAQVQGHVGTLDDVGFFDHTGKPSMRFTKGSEGILATVWGGLAGQFGLTLDKSSKAWLSGTAQTINSGDAAHQVSFPVSGAKTWAQARAGIIDAATSAATTMPV